MDREPDAYKRAWRDFRFRKRLFWGLFLGYVPVLALLGMVLGHLGLLGSNANDVMVALGLAWMLAWFVVGIRYPLFRCPRCQKRFIAWHRRNPYFVRFATKCSNCGLGLGETPEPQTQPDGAK